jgi:hypothetical protein
VSETFPVTVAVRRPDGSIEHVRVGSAVRAGDGFRLTLGDLAISATPDAAGAGAPRRSASGSASGSASMAPPSDGGMVFPPYGRSKGAPIVGASRQDLEFYANGCRRTLSDPAKSRWHDKERVLLAAIEAELARQGGGGGDLGGGDRGDGGWAGGGRGGGSGGGGGSGASGSGSGAGGGWDGDDEPPPRGDEDIPF